MSLLNYVPHVPLRLRALRAFTPSRLHALRAWHASVPYVPSRFTCLIYAPYLSALPALFVNLKIFWRWICSWSKSFDFPRFKALQTVLFYVGQKTAMKLFKCGNYFNIFKTGNQFDVFLFYFSRLMSPQCIPNMWLRLCLTFKKPTAFIAKIKMTVNGRT